jgi:hypothetical protein
MSEPSGGAGDGDATTGAATTGAATTGAATTGDATTGDATTGDATTGAAADGVLRLLTAVQDWAARTFPPPADGVRAGSDCDWCPICQFMAVVRGERPEVSERIVDAGASLVSALRAFVDAAAGPGECTHRDHKSGPQPRPRVQRIDLDTTPAEEHDDGG